MERSVDERVLADIQALTETFRAAFPARPGHFWDELSAKHAALIREHGFANFKRTLNFEYCQWGVSSFRDPKIPRIAKNLLRLGTLPTGGLLARADLAQAETIRWPDGIDPYTAASGKRPGFGGRERLRAYAFYCGLLWQYARRMDRLGCLGKVEEPALGNPMPVRYRGRLISQDLALVSLILNRIAAEIPLAGIRRVLEIGAGYGRLAHAFHVLFPRAEYTILDIPPALAVSRHYLEGVLGPGSVLACFDAPYPAATGGGIRVLPAHRAAELPDRSFDLVINVSSFDEMEPAEVAGYLRLLDRVGTGWLYVQGFARSIAPGRRLGLEELPYGPDWRQVYSAPDPVASGFVEKIFRRA